MGHREDLERHIREVQRLINEYEEKKRLADDPIEKTRARKRIDEQSALAIEYLQQYFSLCRTLKLPVPADVREFAICVIPPSELPEFVKGVSHGERDLISGGFPPQYVSLRTLPDEVKHALTRLEAMSYPELRKWMNGHFSLGELRTTIFDLGIDDSTFKMDTKAATIREMISFCERHDRLSGLLRYLAEVRTSCFQILKGVRENEVEFG